jgi:hypothetical protein
VRGLRKVPTGPRERGGPGSSRATGGSLGTAAVALVFALGVAGAAGRALAPTAALADGGTIRLSGLEFGDYRVTVFTDPTPVRPDSIDVSFLITESDGLSVAEGLEVWMEVTPLDHPGVAATHAATREQADDPRMYAAKFSLGSPGEWRIEIWVEGDRGAGTASFTLRASEGGLLDRPAVFLAAALMPLLLVGLWLRYGNRSRPSEG